MTLLSSRPRRAEDEGVRILFLDIEGVMTRGMLGIGPTDVRSLWFFHSMPDDCDGDYSDDATRLVGRLVNDHNFRIVIISRHGMNEGVTLQKRLANAGIAPEWLYADPDAIGEHTKDQGLNDWWARNPQIRVEQTVCFEDHPDKITVLPRERVIAVDGKKGLSHKEYRAALEIMGLAEKVRTVPAAIRPQGRPAPKA